MIVSLQKKFVFIGIQKTGTTTVEAALQPYANRVVTRYYREKHSRWANRSTNIRYKHVPATMAQNIVGQRKWDRYFTFTFVRNPWARTLSEFTGHRHQPEYAAYKDMELVEGFRAWVADGGNWLVRENTMRDFIMNQDGESCVNFVGRLENFDEDWEEVADRLHLERSEIFRRNESPKKIGVVEAYDAKTAETVYDWIKGDLEYFGYPKTPFAA